MFSILIWTEYQATPFWEWGTSKIQFFTCDIAYYLHFGLHNWAGSSELFSADIFYQ